MRNDELSYCFFTESLSIVYNNLIRASINFLFGYNVLYRFHIFRYFYIQVDHYEENFRERYR